MAILFKKSRAQKRSLRNKFHGAAREPETRRPAETAAAANTPAYTLSADIPESYNDTYVRAIPRDPQHTFVYWEVPTEKAATCGVPDKGNAHVENDKVHWIQGRIEAAREHQQHYHHHHQWHDNHHHQWHDNSHHHHRQDNHQWHDNHHHQNNHHQWHDNHQQTMPVPVIPMMSIMTMIPGILTNRQHDDCQQYALQPLPAMSSGILYNINSEKNA